MSAAAVISAVNAIPTTSMLILFINVFSSDFVVLNQFDVGELSICPPHAPPFSRMDCSSHRQTRYPSGPITPPRIPMVVFEEND
jgi:hypothetical protein